MSPLSPTFLIHFVDSPLKSASFYSRILEMKPVEESPTFVLFAFQSGIHLGLWSCHTATPRPASLAGGSELCFTLESAAAVDTLYNKWLGSGVPIPVAPVCMEKEGIARSFVAYDPDGHRIRVMALGE